jgi:hypothetical protein
MLFKEIIVYYCGQNANVFTNKHVAHVANTVFKEFKTKFHQWTYVNDEKLELFKL